MAIAVWNAWTHDVPGLLATSSHGAWLAMNGWASDLEFCARRDVVGIVPVLKDDRITPLETA